MFNKKIVFITGASSGIGASCATRFAEAHARLLLCARRLDKLNELANNLKKQYGIDVLTFELDVRDYDAVKNALQHLPSDWQNIDVLINNAGLAAGLDPLQKANVSDWEDMINTNVKGLLYVTRLILPNMIEKNAGHIINIGSIAGHTIYPNGAVYCATKHAVKVLTEGLRMDLFGTKVRVTSVDPGAVETNFSIVRFKGDEKKAAAVYE